VNPKEAEIVRMKFAEGLLVLAAAALMPGAAVAQVTAKFAVTLPEKSHQGQGVARFVQLSAPL